jgi:hypothetical protein
MDTDWMAFVVVTALKLALAIVIPFGSADIHHAQSTSLPDGIQAVAKAQGSVSQKFTNLEIGKACPQLAKAVREQAALIGVGWM